ncbi:MAG TPA: DedA family protein [Candidatus Polarisedimenticolaceae bacterium]|nr:DedA family protein [Candidatus Polarisedimenticolaceae bacterium]
MELISQLLDFVLHVDRHLADLTATYGVWVYAVLFAVVFLETGVVVTPFLPGDSLLFAAGAIAAVPGSALNVHLLFLLLFVAAVAGDSMNYAIGNRIGPRVFRENWRFLNRKHLERTQAFYERHGGKTIFLARFVPIVRTFAPFVAGIGTMSYRRFLAFNVGGAFVWVSLFLYAGYFFGRLPLVRDNFSVVILAIIVLSVVPIAVEVLRARRT